PRPAIKHRVRLAIHIRSLNSPDRHHDHPSFPTRRSSDLPGRRSPTGESPTSTHCWSPAPPYRAERNRSVERQLFDADHDAFRERSEEHTSELQSPYDLVCRLLLEKKNSTRHRTILLPSCL